MPWRQLCSLLFWIKPEGGSTDRRTLLHCCIEDRRLEPLQATSRCSVQIKDDDLVVPCLQPWARNIKRHLRPEVPDPAQRMSSQPELSLGEGAGVQEGISRLFYVEGGAVKTGPRTRSAAVTQGPWIRHG